MIAGVFYVFGLALVVGLIAGAILWHAYVFCLLWEWFVVPITGWPHLSLAAALGVLMLISSARMSKYVEPTKFDERKDRAIEFGKQLLHLLIRPAILLLAGWCAKGFI